MSAVDAVVVGSGPNGLTAAIVIAQTGRKVVVFESASTWGGGCRSAALTLPGFVHDICSAVHPFAVGSPIFRSLPLAAHGVEWIEPPVMVALLGSRFSVPVQVRFQVPHGSAFEVRRAPPASARTLNPNTESRTEGEHEPGSENEEA